MYFEFCFTFFSILNIFLHYMPDACYQGMIKWLIKVKLWWKESINYDETEKTEWQRQKIVKWLLLKRMMTILKVSLHTYNFCYNSTIIRIIVISWQNNFQIKDPFFENVKINLQINLSSEIEYLNKNIQQKCTLMKKMVILPYCFS